MIFNIIAIVILGIVTSYTDLKRRIIENRVILIGLVAAPFLHITQIALNPELASAIPSMMYNLLFAVFAGMLLWYTRIWPAGDAKLFITFTFLLPLNIYNTAGVFISFDFLINTFVPVFFVMLAVLLARSGKKEIMKSLKFALNPYTMLFTIIVILGFLEYLFLFMGFLGIPQNYLIAVVILFAVMEVLNKVSPINLEYLYIILAVVRIITDYRAVFSYAYLYYLLTLLLSFLILRYFVIDLGFRRYTFKKKIKDLKPGICLAEGIYKTKDGDKIEYDKRRIAQFSVVSGLSDRGKDFIHGVTFDGLTRKEVDMIKKLKKEGKLHFDEVLVHTITPFALFLFIGVLITVLLGTSFIQYIRMIVIG